MDAFFKAKVTPAPLPLVVQKENLIAGCLSQKRGL
jgi:hypothetical protein